MKKFTALILVCVILSALFASCGTHEAAKTLDALLASVKSGDFANASVIANGPFANEDDVMMNAMYKNFDYKIGDVTENGDGVEVAVTITMTDIGTVFANYMTEALENAANSDWDSEDTRFVEMLGEDGVATKTFDIKVNMVKESDAWTVADENEALVDALTGGLFSSLGNLVEE